MVLAICIALWSRDALVVRAGEYGVAKLRREPELQVKDTCLAQILDLTACLADICHFVPITTPRSPFEKSKWSFAHFARPAMRDLLHSYIRCFAKTRFAEDGKLCSFSTDSVIPLGEWLHLHPTFWRHGTSLTIFDWSIYEASENKYYEKYSRRRRRLCSFSRCPAALVDFFFYMCAERGKLKTLSRLSALLSLALPGSLPTDSEIKSKFDTWRHIKLTSHFKTYH